jgi:hypothetical protein
MPKSLGLDALGGPATATIVGTLSPRGDLVNYAQLSSMPIHLQGEHIGKGLHFQSFWMAMELALRIGRLLVAIRRWLNAGGCEDAGVRVTDGAVAPLEVLYA